MKNYANFDVLKFYKKLPFNYYGSIEVATKNIIETNLIKSYPNLSPIIKKSTNIIDIGCGVGWFVNGTNYHYKKYGVEVCGIDYNPVAIEQAKKISSSLNVNSNFKVASLFEYNPNQSYDLAVSIGVLHHTDNCIEALRCVFRNYIKKNGYAFIGLYHKYGRKPFLEYFKKLKEQGLKEKQLFEKFIELRGKGEDETHNLSWFHDQVLHPHETQHSLEEIISLLDSENMKLISTSINRFKSFKTKKELIETEKSYYEIATQKLKDKIYFPGFFIFLAQKK